MPNTIREALAELKFSEQITDITIIDSMSNYFDRSTDMDSIKSAIKVRYGTGTKIVRDPAATDDDAGIEVYDKGLFNKQVDSGQIEAVTSGFGARIVNALATLFTEEQQRYQLVHDTAEDLEAAETLLNEHRENGYSSEIVKADEKACQLGSSALFLEFVTDTIVYNVLTPADVRPIFGTTITIQGADGEDKTRAVRTDQIEDATAVIIRLSAVDEISYNYLAIFGRSEDWPNGRYVQYQSTEPGSDVPDVGDGSAIEYEINGDIANPLTYLANQFPDLYIPEYPIAILDGGITEGTGVMPVTSSLYNDAIEIDVSSSHLIGTSQDAARGTNALERDVQGVSQPTPKSLKGDVALGPGQKIVHVEHGAGESEVALRVLHGIMTSIAEGYGVPDYMAVPEQSGPRGGSQDTASGVALMVKTRPLKKARKKRIDKNKKAVKKIFDIEKGLIWLFDDDPAKELLFQCRQNWDAGELLIPENNKEKVDRLVQAKKDGVIDEIQQIKEYYNLPTDEEAIEIYDRMKQRAADYPPLKQPEQPPAPKKLGLVGRGGQQQPPQQG
jgi:hypothetical protein